MSYEKHIILDIRSRKAAITLTLSKRGTCIISIKSNAIAWSMSWSSDLKPWDNRANRQNKMKREPDKEVTRQRSKL